MYGFIFMTNMLKLTNYFLFENFLITEIKNHCIKNFSSFFFEFDIFLQIYILILFAFSFISQIRLYLTGKKEVFYSLDMVYVILNIGLIIFAV